MSLILVDSSIWIDYFNKGIFADEINSLLSKGKIATCGLVKTELFPFFKKDRITREYFLNRLRYLSFSDSYWDTLISLQDRILHHGLNRMALPDLILAGLCFESDCFLFTKDKDFYRIKDIIGLKLYDWQS